MANEFSTEDKFLTEEGLIYYDKRLKDYISTYVSNQLTEVDPELIEKAVQEAMDAYIQSEEAPIVTTENISEAVATTLCTDLITEGAPADAAAVGRALEETAKVEIIEGTDEKILTGVDIISAPTDISELI